MTSMFGGVSVRHKITSLVLFFLCYRWTIQCFEEAVLIWIQIVCFSVGQKKCNYRQQKTMLFKLFVSTLKVCQNKTIIVLSLAKLLHNTCQLQGGSAPLTFHMKKKIMMILFRDWQTHQYVKYLRMHRENNANNLWGETKLFKPASSNHQITIIVKHFAKDFFKMKVSKESQ